MDDDVAAHTHLGQGGTYLTPGHKHRNQLGNESYR